MKKYVKPELFYEYYELSQHIADCAWEITLAEAACIANGDKDKGLGGFTLFTTDLSCIFVPVEYGGTYQAYCYHDGENGVNTFAS